MSEKERERIFAKLQQGMTEEEFQAFKQFKKEGNKHLEEKSSKDYSPWTTDFLTFLNMIQMFGDCVKHISFSEPFRIVVDYDPEQVRTAIHCYSTDRFVSQSSPLGTE